jgi:hypothetical protein
MKAKTDKPKLPINTYYHWFVLQEWISQGNLSSKKKSEMWNVMRSLFQEKHINYSMFIVELAVSDIITNITLENSDIMLISH